MSLQERRQDASASKGIEGFAYNRQILKWHPKGFEAQPLIRRKQSTILRTVLNLGPLTIEEVRTKTGAVKYKFTARTVKLATDETLATIIKRLEKHLQATGYHKDQRKYYLDYQKARREHYQQKNREYYLLHKDEMNAKARARRQEQKALKAAMQNLPSQAC